MRIHDQALNLIMIPNPNPYPTTKQSTFHVMCWRAEWVSTV